MRRGMSTVPPSAVFNTLQRIALVSTHGYVAASPPLGAADTGGQVVYVLELAKKLAQLGHHVDVWTRQFEDQPDCERVQPRVRILRVPCGGREFIAKEYLHQSLREWSQAALARMAREDLHYRFVNSHYWDAGVAGRYLCAELGIPHLHTPHSLGAWKQRQMLADYPESAETFERVYACNVPALAEVAPDVPPALAAVVHRALAAEPSSRFWTALEMKQALDGAMMAANVSLGEPEIAASIARLVPDRVREHEAWLAEADRIAVEPTVSKTHTVDDEPPPKTERIASKSTAPLAK